MHFQDCITQKYYSEFPVSVKGVASSCLAFELIEVERFSSIKASDNCGIEALKHEHKDSPQWVKLLDMIRHMSCTVKIVCAILCSINLSHTYMVS